MSGAEGGFQLLSLLPAALPTASFSLGDGSKSQDCRNLESLDLNCLTGEHRKVQPCPLDLGVSVTASIRMGQRKFIFMGDKFQAGYELSQFMTLYVL